MTQPHTSVQTKSKTAVEQRLSVGFLLATSVIMSSSLLAFALFTSIWKWKV